MRVDARGWGHCHLEAAFGVELEPAESVEPIGDVRPIEELAGEIERVDRRVRRVAQIDGGGA